MAKIKTSAMRVERPSLNNEQAAAEAARLMGTPKETRTVRIVAKVTESERRKLKALALEQGLELQQLILDAIAAQHPGTLGG